MAERVMFVQLKTGHDTDKGPAWISRVRFTKSWQTAYWLSGPHRDRADTRYSNIRPQIDDDVRDLYEAFLSGATLPGRERG
ncbi:hypothetical protein HC031_07835 [Planosporangium thailandense]|uniref:Uncharacterized protein n=1 Tax=Planosporangium thailandense TaxID=765197 RepID=A0ABX0XUE5_9ACTN|nr:hypothetical protein [Planosporangium thailandense]NJC69628.1 hypothetical protein [Planosporangium thailandense]